MAFERAVTDSIAGETSAASERPRALASRSALRNDAAMVFLLDSRLAADCIVVGDLALCRVLLMNDARFPWLILVPRRTGAREIIDLLDEDQAQLMREVAVASRALRVLVAPHKLNVAALGNSVAQLHVHVIARTQTDAAWPRPVWGVGEAAPYAAGAAQALAAKIDAVLVSITQTARV